MTGASDEDTWRIRDEPDKKDDDRFFGLRDQPCFESFRIQRDSYGHKNTRRHTRSTNIRAVSFQSDTSSDESDSPLTFPEKTSKASRFQVTRKNRHKPDHLRDQTYFETLQNSTSSDESDSPLTFTEKTSRAFRFQVRFSSKEIARAIISNRLKHEAVTKSRQTRQNYSYFFGARKNRHKPDHLRDQTYFETLQSSTSSDESDSPLTFPEKTSRAFRFQDYTGTRKNRYKPDKEDDGDQNPLESLQIQHRCHGHTYTRRHARSSNIGLFSFQSSSSSDENDFPLTFPDRTSKEFRFQDTWRIRDEPDKNDDDRFFGLRDQPCFESFWSSTSGDESDSPPPVQDHFLNDLLWTGVKGTKWPNRTYLIASIKSSYGEGIFNKRFVNIPSTKDAEAVMLCDDDFCDAVAVHHDIEITLTLNYSPCSNCANKLRDFYENHRNIRNLIIQFSFLYRIHEEKNQYGLRDLREAGVTLQAMNANSWREVGVDLESMASSDVNRITERDEDTEDMLNKVLFTYESEQDQDTSDDDDDLSSRFHSRLIFW